MRYQVTGGFRVEAGIGAGDGGDVNTDLAGVIGTHNPTKTWNYYASVRLGAVRGWLNCGHNTNHAPGALVPLGAIGSTARISDNVKFVMEAGPGGSLLGSIPLRPDICTFHSGFCSTLAKTEDELRVRLALTARKILLTCGIWAIQPGWMVGKQQVSPPLSGLPVIRPLDASLRREVKYCPPDLRIN